MAFSMAQDVMAEIAGRRIEPARLAMVGDSLHTDVLGGAAAGLQTVLVTHHGLFRGQEVGPYFDQCAFRPDWVVDTL
jgi:ribonucleotide monophosphatase NagD (HAD superfamily)